MKENALYVGYIKKPEQSERYEAYDRGEGFKNITKDPR
jgi:hypothetical protein